MINNDNNDLVSWRYVIRAKISVQYAPPNDCLPICPLPGTILLERDCEIILSLVMKTIQLSMNVCVVFSSLQGVTGEQGPRGLQGVGGQKVSGNLLLPGRHSHPRA